MRRRRDSSAALSSGQGRCGRGRPAGSSPRPTISSRTASTSRSCSSSTAARSAGSSQTRRAVGRQEVEQGAPGQEGHVEVVVVEALAGRQELRLPFERWPRAAGCRSRGPAARGRRPSLAEGRSISRAGPTAASSSRPVERWVSGRNERMLSTRSPSSSMRRGSSSAGGKTSMMPPRRLAWPGMSTRPEAGSPSGRAGAGRPRAPAAHPPTAARCPRPAPRGRGCAGPPPARRRRRPAGLGRPERAYSVRRRSRRARGSGARRS